jgi:drug/metabolite transporter (DMT)-like permease
MTFVLLNIIFSSCFILCVRWWQQRGDDVVNVGAVNYIVAALTITPIYLSGEQVPVTFNSCLTGTLGGVFYFVAFFFLIVTTSWKGAANTTVVSRLSILVPILCGVLFWHERPGSLQVVGIVLACTALMLIGRRAARLEDAEPPPYAFLLLAVFFLMGGCCRLSQEMFKHLCHPDERQVFLLLTFGVSGIASVVLLAVRRRVPTRREFVAGIALGTTNLVQTYCILRALESLPGYVIFPMTAAGGLLFTTGVAVFFLSERLDRLSYAGLAIAIGALSLLHPSLGKDVSPAAASSTSSANVAQKDARESHQPFHTRPKFRP